MTHHPIGDLAFLSDMHSAALIDRAGTVAWLSFPRFDSPSVFTSLLGEEAGHWQIGPTGDAEVTRRYLPDSLVLETTFTTPRGTAVLTDALALAPDDDDALLGGGAPHSMTVSAPAGVEAVIRGWTDAIIACPRHRQRCHGRRRSRAHEPTGRTENGDDAA